MICHLILLTVAATPQRVVFSTENGHGASLYVASLDGKTCKKITPGTFDDSDPVWSPNGAWIAFTRAIPWRIAANPRSHIFLIRPNGSGVRQLTDGPKSDDHPGWSSDSRHIVFMRDGTTNGAIKVGVDGKGLQPVNDPFDYTQSGNWAAILKPTTKTDGLFKSDLWLEDLRTQATRRITHLGDNMSAPVWSPDGTKLLLVVEHGFLGTKATFKIKGEVEGPPTPDQEHTVTLYSVAIPSGQLKVLDRGHISRMETPVFSPDGKRFAYLKAIDTDSSRNESFEQLYIMNSNGTGRHRLTNHFGNDYTPQWARDGRTIVMGSDRVSMMIEINGWRDFSEGGLTFVNPVTKRARAVRLPVRVRHIALSR